MPDLPLSGGRGFGVSPSFMDALAEHGPEPFRATSASPQQAAGQLAIPHGTTIIGLKFSGGVVMAGDRRATEGYSIADEKIEKVFQADDYSCVSIAGAAGQATEIVRLFQTELEHYEKVEGERLSLEGKANRLAQMIRGNFPMALQGLVVVPLFGGFDERRAEGRLFRYDATGGRWEEENYMATGSGGRPAKGTLKKLWRPGLSRDDALRIVIESLRDASEEDVATGGPDPVRGIWPSVKVVTSDGVEEIADPDLKAAYDAAGGEGS
ncbi:MAG TPA: proteasome subunit beta [Actinomycetota bacterium]